MGSIPENLRGKEQVMEIGLVQDSKEGFTEKLIREILTPVIYEQQQPERIELYCDFVRMIVSVAYNMGSIEGEDGPSMQFTPDAFPDMENTDAEILLKGLTHHGILMEDKHGLRLTKRAFRMVNPPPKEAMQ